MQPILLTYKHRQKAICYNYNATLLYIYFVNFRNRIKEMYAPLSEIVLIFFLEGGVQFPFLVLCPGCVLNARKNLSY